MGLKKLTNPTHGKYYAQEERSGANMGMELARQDVEHLDGL